MAITDFTGSAEAKSEQPAILLNIDEEAVEMCRTVLDALLSGEAKGLCGMVKTEDGFAMFASRAIVSIKGDEAINALGELMGKIQ